MCFPLLSDVSWSVPTTASPNAFQRRGPRGLVSIPLPSWSIARNTSILGRDPNSVVSLFAQLFLRRTQRLPNIRNTIRGRKHSETQSARSAFNEDGFLNDKEWLYGLNLVFSASVTSSRSVVKFWSKKDPLRVSSLHCTAAGGALKGLLSPPLQLNTLRLYKEDAVGMPNMLQICTLHIVHINSLLSIMPGSFMFNMIYVFEVEIHKRLFSMPNWHQLTHRMH